MLLSSLLLIPILGIFLISSDMSYEAASGEHVPSKIKSYKITAFVTSLVNLAVSLVIFILFDFSSNQFQFVQEHYNINFFDIYLGVDGISIYFVLLTTIIMPIAILSNWNSITENVKSYLIIMLLLETLLIAVFLVLDILLFYIFFESILPPLFLLIGLFGSSNKVRASFYLFLYTLFKNPYQCKIAKLRRNPKALATKVIKETLWLVPGIQGSKVISLKMKDFNLFIKWGIAYLNQIFSTKSEFVKEQRVDGYADSRILVSEKCTLIAGKPVLGRKIPFHPDNRRIGMGFLKQRAFKHSIRPASPQNNLALDEQVKNSLLKQPTAWGELALIPKACKKDISSFSLAPLPKLDPWFITGFTDAEGCFMVGLFASSSYRTGYQVQAIFKINLDNKDFNLLCKIKDYFGGEALPF